jgi:hypothetical protein
MSDLSTPDDWRQGFIDADARHQDAMNGVERERAYFQPLAGIFTDFWERRPVTRWHDWLDQCGVEKTTSDNPFHRAVKHARGEGHKTQTSRIAGALWRAHLKFLEHIAVYPGDADCCTGWVIDWLETGGGIKGRYSEFLADQREDEDEDDGETVSPGKPETPRESDEPEHSQSSASEAQQQPPTPETVEAGTPPETETAAQSEPEQPPPPEEAETAADAEQPVEPYQPPEQTKVDKLLVKTLRLAIHAGTGDGEALAALRTAQKMDPDLRWLEKVDSDFYFDKSLEEWRLMLIGYKQNEVALEAENAKLKKENDRLKKQIEKLRVIDPVREAAD